MLNTDSAPVSLPSIADAELMIAEAGRIVQERYTTLALAAGRHVLTVGTRGPTAQYDGTVLWVLEHPGSCPTSTCPIALELLTRPLDMHLPDRQGAYLIELEDDCLNPPYARCVELPDLP